MFEELIIWGPQVADEHDTLAELSEKDRAYLAKELEGLDDKWGISLNKTICSLLDCLKRFGIFIRKCTMM